MALSEVSVNGTVVNDRQIRIAGPGRLEAGVVTAGDPVTLTGVIEREGKPAPGVFIVLIPAGGDTSEDLFRRDQSDLDGGFTFPGVAPGNYIAVAVDGGWDLPWTDLRTVSKYLSRGVPVTVNSAMHGVRLKEAVVPQPR